MPKYRSIKTFKGRHMAGARALWRATGVKEEDFNKPLIAVVNSFSEFVPGHVHLRNIGKLISKQIQIFGGVAKEFNTIAIDDGIAMGHSGMLYSLPSRELIADSIEYVINAHCVDAMVCISNCDKITPGMLMAALRLNIPTIFVSGGPMEAGRIKLSNGKEIRLDLVDVMVKSANPNITDSETNRTEKLACPTCGSCSGMFTANSMNCLMEALGLSFPGNGSLLATHIFRKKLFLSTGKQIVKITKKYYENNDENFLPRKIASIYAFENAMMLDIAMGGSTNTILHLLAAANEAEVNFNLSKIDKLSRKVPYLCKVSPNTNKYYIEDVHRAGGVVGILGELYRSRLLNKNVKNIMGLSIKEVIMKYDITIKPNKEVKKMYSASPSGNLTKKAFSQNSYFSSLDYDRKFGCIRSFKYAYSVDGGLAVLFGNLAKNGCVVKTAGVNKNSLIFSGSAKVFESQEEAVYAILNKKIKNGNVVVIRYEGPKGGPGMQEMLYPTSYLKSMGLSEHCALITDGRFSGGTSGLSIGHISPEAANGGVIALVEDGDIIEINIPNRQINLNVDEKILKNREKIENKRGINAWTPKKRKRNISNSLKFYSLLATSADQGAIRNKIKIRR